MKKRVFSGTRATGRLHLGNYLGAVKGYIALQNDPSYECVYMAVDVHTVTTPFDPKTLQTATRDIIMDYLAAGLDPGKAIITKQSLVPEHTELAFLFSSVMNVARLQDLPTFKEKIRQHPQSVTMALLNYPMLMAADILIYKAGLVPCGLDQEPHLEITREVARKMNQAFGTDFPEVQRFVTEGQYVPSLAGEGKMSKSVEGSFINLTDDLDSIRKKIRQVQTETTSSGKQLEKGTGINTLFELLRLFSQPEESAKFKRYLELRSQYLSPQGDFRFGLLKDELSELIYQELKPIREKRKELESKPEYVDQVIIVGAEKARVIASATVAEVKQKMGLG